MPESQPEVRVVTSEDGVAVFMSVPVAEGMATFTIDAQRDEDGDWRVFIPWTRERSSETVLIADASHPAHAYDCVNGIVYLAGPEVE